MPPAAFVVVSVLTPIRVLTLMVQQHLLCCIFCVNKVPELLLRQVNFAIAIYQGLYQQHFQFPGLERNVIYCKYRIRLTQLMYGMETNSERRQ